MREVSEYLGFVVPLLISVYYGWVRHQRHLLEQIRKHLLSSASSLLSNRLSLNVVSVGDALDGKLEILLRVFRLGVVQSLPSQLEQSNKPRHQQQQHQQPGEESVECLVLHDPGQGRREADIIFIHGLKGALEKTWTQGITKELEGEMSKCWPRDWLPVDCPNVRVIALNYTTDPYLWRPFWVEKPIRTRMKERSWEMMENLVKIGVGEQSIVWVGHSKGGLYVKQVLVNACETLDLRYNDLSRNTRGVLFYSVPHRGSSLANLNLPLLRQSIELMEVQKDSDQLLTLHEKFKKLLDTEQLKLNVKSFIETQMTLMSFLYLRIVSEESADAQIGETIGVPLDHRNICKPRSRECFLYRELVDLIQTVCGDT